MTAPSVLVVDDDRTTLDVHQRLFEKAETASVRAFDTAEAALAAAAAQPADIICCDLKMPGIDGFQFLRALAALEPLPVVAFVSGADDQVLNVVARLGRSLGLTVAGAFPKPLRLSTVGTILDVWRRREPAPARTVRAEPSGDAIVEAIRARRFVPFFQPKIRSSTRRLAGFEALARLELEDGSIVPPGLFLYATRQSGAMDAMTDIVMQRAFAFSSENNAVSVAVNVTARQLTNLDLPDQIMTAAHSHGLPLEAITVEVTETEAIENLASMQEVLGRLALQGVRISIDDFGAGFSNLSRVAGMPIRELKVDGDIVMASARQPAYRAVLDVSITLADRLGVTLVAEGIEAEEELALFEPSDRLVFQGYHFARPLPADAAAQWVRGAPSI